jgi:hypothetical protein
MTALNAVFDIFGLISYGDTATRMGIRNDAMAFSQEIAPILSPTMVGVLWAVIALLMFAVSVYYAIWKPLHAEVNEAYRRATE